MPENSIDDAYEEQVANVRRWVDAGNSVIPVEHVRNVLAAYDRRGQLMDLMYDALGPANDDVMDAIYVELDGGG